MRLGFSYSSRIGLRELRAHPLRTALSTLGITIGVGALVAVLGIGDGAGRMARAQIEETTNVQLLQVVPRTRERVDGVSVRRQNVPTLSFQESRALGEELGETARVLPVAQAGVGVSWPGDTMARAGMLTATSPEAAVELELEMAAGRFLSAADAEADPPVVVIPEATAVALAGEGEGAGAAIGRRIELQGFEVEVVGAFRPGKGANPQAIYGSLASEALRNGVNLAPTSLYVKVYEIEDIVTVRTAIEAWLAANYPDWERDFSVLSMEGRVAQVQQAMQVFKLVLGAITGISILVGGIGVMNVLLVSITERTTEIGVRRAIGASRSDVLIQFLSEAVMISSIGSLMGLALGAGVAVFSAAVIRRLTEAPFTAAWSPTSFVIVAAVAILTGLVFGAYPAARASRLPPAEAIRHE